MDTTWDDLNTTSDDLSYALGQLTRAKRHLARARDSAAVLQEKEDEENEDEEEEENEDEEEEENEDEEEEENKDEEDNELVEPELVDVPRETFEELRLYNLTPIIVFDCQQCIELAAKAIFKAVGKNHPKTHQFWFDQDATGGVMLEVPINYHEVARVFFLTRKWYEFYNEARYGEPELNLSPQHLLRPEDAKRAIEDAEYCLEVSEQVCKYVGSLCMGEGEEDSK